MCCKRRSAYQTNQSNKITIKRHDLLQAPPPPEGYSSAAHLAALYSSNAGPRPSKKAFRALPGAPERILDAPDLLDDYYLNLLDWSSTNIVRRVVL